MLNLLLFVFDFRRSASSVCCVRPVASDHKEATRLPIYFHGRLIKGRLPVALDARGTGKVAAWVLHRTMLTSQLCPKLWPSRHYRHFLLFWWNKAPLHNNQLSTIELWFMTHLIESKTIDRTFGCEAPTCRQTENWAGRRSQQPTKDRILRNVYQEHRSESIKISLKILSALEAIGFLTCFQRIGYLLLIEASFSGPPPPPPPPPRRMSLHLRYQIQPKSARRINIPT